ncbi:MAG: FtsX-like permease family protein [Alkalibacterium gilvum]|uniref:Putative ABC transport system permease protein n=1 Tax=Alkalibacterium gilvum TaxID=1130080 RepID=A0A1H6VIB3_9LACT|nr:ABC transporter permease [Alkalibacterium gilvum]SEJ00470.1 putative ABC transport system permease protein [Alkalibacterium gilvum]
MYFKIAIKNVKKSFKDYSIYFLTLTLAVCIFYSFNSLESQEVLTDIEISGKSYVDTLSTIISYMSVFVAFILGSLILYANNFLIKKRNKELGIYMTLGMSKGTISKILIYETLLVGALSLISGIMVGLLTSQGLSIMVSKLFEINLDNYSFIISLSSILKTIAYFGMMYFLVMIFNTYIIAKYKIIDLLTVGRKTEEIKFKNPVIYLITFLLCILSLGSAYVLILDVGLDPKNFKFILSIILGMAGTLLFFYSLSGAALYIVKRNKKIYFKGLNIFVIKQINSKINTNFISMSVVCLMLFLTIGILSTGFSFKSALESGLKGSTPFDASAYLFVDEEDEIKNISTALDNLNFTFDEEDEVVFYNEYTKDLKISDILPMEKDLNQFQFEVSFIKASDYNNIRKLEGKQEIQLDDSDLLLTSNYSELAAEIQTFMDDNDTLKLSDSVYEIQNTDVINTNLKTDFAENNLLTIIIDDAFLNDASVITSVVNIEFANKSNSQSKKDFEELMYDYKQGKIDPTEGSFILGNTRSQIYEENKGLTTTLLFVGIYLGIVFLISSMAVLALQQLSEASDSIPRYISLKKLGASKKNIIKTIFVQTLIYFSIPIGLALVHSIVGIQVANDFISAFNKPDIGTASLITAGFLSSIYAIYFYTTYIGYKNIVLSKI